MIRRGWVRSVEKSKKQEVVKSLRQAFEGSSLVLVTQQRGLNVVEVTDLRRQMREAGASYKVAKNTLIRLAIKDTKYAGLIDHLQGPTALAFSEDPVAAAKVIVKFAKENNKLTVISGAMQGAPLKDSEIKSLASLPSLDELRAKLVALIQTPATLIVDVIQTPSSQLARLIGNYGAQALR
jgi:large subunit ribosomal protein L10